MIVDAALAQGHINPCTIPPVTLLWRALEKIRGFANIRDRKIVKQLSAHTRGEITESEWDAFVGQHSHPFHLLSKRLETHQLMIHFEITEGTRILHFIGTRAKWICVILLITR